MEGEKPGMKAGTLEQGHMRRLCLLCCMAYFMSYLTRLDYAACMVEIQKSLQVGKDVVGLPVTACFASYGVGQLLCGFLGDRCRPQRMIFAGLLGSSVCNILAAWLPWMEAVTLVWCMNGFFQSMLWPPMVRIMAQSMDEAWYRRSCVLVSMASAAATILIYLCVPLCIRFSGWKTVFFLAAFLGAAASFVWIALTGKLECGRKPEGTEKGEEAGNGGDGKARSGGFFGGAPMVPILLAIALHGILRDGIITWMPTYMSEVFGMSSSGSILSAHLQCVQYAGGLLASAAPSERAGDRNRPVWNRGSGWSGASGLLQCQSGGVHQHDDADHGLYVRREPDADQQGSGAFCKAGECGCSLMHSECRHLCGQLIFRQQFRSSGGKYRVAAGGSGLGGVRRSWDAASAFRNTKMECFLPKDLKFPGKN